MRRESHTLRVFAAVLAGALGLSMYENMKAGRPDAPGTIIVYRDVPVRQQEQQQQQQQRPPSRSAGATLVLSSLPDVCESRPPRGFERYGPPCASNAHLPALAAADRYPDKHAFAFMNDGLTPGTREGDVPLFPHNESRTAHGKWSMLMKSAGTYGGAFAYACDTPKRDMWDQLGNRTAAPYFFEGYQFHAYPDTVVKKDRIVYIYKNTPVHSLEECLRYCMADERCYAVEVWSNPKDKKVHRCEYVDSGLALTASKNEGQTTLYAAFQHWKPFLYTREYIYADVFRMKMALAFGDDDAVAVPGDFGAGLAPGAPRLKAFYETFLRTTEDASFFTEFGDDGKNYPDWRLPAAEAAKPCYFAPGAQPRKPGTLDIDASAGSPSAPWQKRFIAANEIDVISFFHFAWVDPFHKLVFFVIPKVASTELVKLYERGLGMPDYPATDWSYAPHYKFGDGTSERFRLGALSPVNASLILNSPLYKKVVLFREPLERMVSAYTEKLKMGSLLQTYKVDNMTFPEFVERLANPELKGVRHSSGPNVDPHYKQQTLVGNLYKFLPLMDFIGWANGDHAKLMLERYGLWESLGESWRGNPEAGFMQRTKRKNSHYTGDTKSKVDTMFTPELREKAIKALALDIALFEEIGLVPDGPPVDGRNAVYRGQRCDKNGFCLPGSPQCL
eukprot:TRINITY_DN17769_c1_g4_i1.p1 TRINITY_DN17769_c1_g4~~TRINITY_DN17769_c1_g4_i1.p1  ORF type:complete len:674 (+),score=197.29 TRINITY_DN17769_c1_g4_i1:69-2090(+)